MSVPFTDENIDVSPNCCFSTWFKTIRVYSDRVIVRGKIRGINIIMLMLTIEAIKILDLKWALCLVLRIIWCPAII